MATPVTNNSHQTQGNKTHHSTHHQQYCQNYWDIKASLWYRWQHPRNIKPWSRHQNNFQVFKTNTIIQLNLIQIPFYFYVCIYSIIHIIKHTM